MSTIEQARDFSKALRIRSAYGSEARQAADTIDALIAENATQRKVLEQALKYIRKTAVFIPHEYDHEGLEATTAIQGVLR